MGCTRSTTIVRKLDIIAGDRGGIIMVPGCETTSDGTSPTLLRNLKCCSSFVYLQDALTAIPGSYVELQYNNGTGYNVKRFVLPPDCTTCPCAENDDWYKVLKDLACALAEPEPVINCGFPVDMGYCPLPDFASTPNTPTSTYFPEGQYPAGVLAQ